MLDIIFVLIGIVLLTAGGEALIRGSLASASRLGISPLLSGIVIIGFGTSAPELVVSVNAALEGKPDIAVGNVVGSNIGNILLILGICAVITPLSVKPVVLKRDAMAMVLATVIFIALAGGRDLDRLDAALFLGALLLYLFGSYWSEKYYAAPSSELHKAEAEEPIVQPKSIFWITVAIVVGLALLVLGSQVLLIGAMGLATYFGLPEALIGLTLVAVGTSLPELSISVIAAIRKHADVAIGNVLGSNIFNILGILGISAILQPLPINARIAQFDQWVMLGVVVMLLLFLLTHRKVSRIEGAILLLGYGLYLWVSFTFFAH